MPLNALLLLAQYQKSNTENPFQDKSKLYDFHKEQEEEETEGVQELPEWKEQELLKPIELILTEGKTTPPAHFHKYSSFQISSRNL